MPGVPGRPEQAQPERPLSGQLQKQLYILLGAYNWLCSTQIPTLGRDTNIPSALRRQGHSNQNVA
jgi:hypothetical protein